MAVELNKKGFEHAKKLVAAGKVVLDPRDDWSEHHPSAEQENAILLEYGFAEYEKWFLGIDPEEPEGTKARCKLPHGDFEDVHRCAVITAESRAAEDEHAEVEIAAAHLHGMLDAQRAALRRTG